ncbi:MAG: urea ABC transporter permease subunit UrtB [Pelistega sp.]|nr:urea ABC transporter permease subunit UrtB [Pelistega sp.]
MVNKKTKVLLRCLSLLLLTFWLVVVGSTRVALASENSSVLEQYLPALNGNNFAQKKQAVEQIASLNNEQANSILMALLEGRLLVDKEDYYVRDRNNNSVYQQVLLNQQVNSAAKAKRVVINNDIRTWLRKYQAQYQLSQGNKEQRLMAIEQILKSNDFSQIENVKAALVHEKDKAIQELMNLFMARADLKQEDASRHSAAIEVLKKSVLPEDLNLLQDYAQNAPTESLQTQVNRAISNIKTKLLFVDGVQTLSYGLSLGSILILTAIGLSITFGVMGVINMAHGELMMLGAYTTYVIQQLLPNHITASLFISLPVAFVVSALVGMLIEALVVRHLYGRPLETLLATFGVSLILQQAMRTIFSPLNRLVQTPEFMQGEWVILPNLSITLNRVYIFIFCMVCFFALLQIMKRTRIGLEVSAISQNRAMAKAMGINDRKVDMLTFGLGSGIAGLAGVALSQLTNVGPNLGQQYIVDSFMVVVTGGVGNLWGTFVSGLGLGIINKFMEPAFGAVLAKALVLVLIILFLQKYSRGLFPQKGRAVE